MRRPALLLVRLCGLAACVGLVPAGWLVAAGALAIALHRRPLAGGAPERWRVADLLVALMLGLALALGATTRACAVLGLAWLQVRAAAVPGPQSASLGVLLCALQLVLAARLGDPLWLPGALVGGAVLGPLALQRAASHATGVGAGAGIAALSVPALGGVVYLLLPRPLPAPVVVSGHLTGFGEEVVLGEIGAIKTSPEVVLRARVRTLDGQSVDPPFYFRGVALDHFDGSTWRQTLPGGFQAGWWPDLPGDPAELLVQDVLLEKGTGGVLFGMPDVQSIVGPTARLTLDTNGTWRVEDVPGAVRYTAHSVRAGVGRVRRFEADPAHVAVGRTHAAALRSGQWSGVPMGLSARLDEITREALVDAPAGEADRARWLAAWMRDARSYTMTPGKSGLESFLFDGAPGHCELFATGLALMLRSAGTPSRVVNGFLADEVDPRTGEVVVRRRDAHSWVEAWVDGVGWVTLDPTPPAPVVAASTGPLSVHELGRRARAYDAEARTSLLSAVRPPAWLVAVCSSGLAVVLLARRVRPKLRRRRSAIATTHDRARRLVRRRGWRIPGELPPLEAARWLQVHAGDSAVPLRELAELHYEVRYGGDPAAIHLRAARAALRALSALPRRRRAG